MGSMGVGDRFEIFFSTSAKREVLSTRYLSASNNTPLVCRRGKARRSRIGTGGYFQWTPALRGIIAAFINIRIRQLEERDWDAPVLSGAHKSLALSLDYAIHKQTDWLLDMFGVNSEGRPCIRDLLFCSNSGLKHSGPVSFFAHKRKVEALHIQVYVGEEVVHDVGALRKLLDDTSVEDLDNSRAPKLVLVSGGIGKQNTRSISFDKNEEITRPPSVVATINSLQATRQLSEAARRRCLDYTASISPSGGMPAPFNTVNNFGLLSQIFSEEVESMLKDTPIFNSQKCKSCIDEAIHDPSFQRVMGRNRSRLSELNIPTNSNIRLGLFHSDSILGQIWSKRELEVVIPGGGAAPMAIFLYLKLIKGYPINIKHDQIGPELIEKLALNSFDRPVDLCVLGSAHLAGLLGHPARSQYLPCMISPKVSFRVMEGAVPHKKRSSLEKGTFLFLNQPDTLSSFYFNSLLRQGKVRKRTSETVFMAPDEIAESINEDPSLKAILWFPYYSFNESFGNARVVNDSSASVTKDNFLLFNERICKNIKWRTALESAIREAWYTLVVNAPIRDLMIQMLINNSSLISYLVRTSGIDRWYPHTPASPKVAKSAFA